VGYPSYFPLQHTPASPHDRGACLCPFGRVATLRLGRNRPTGCGHAGLISQGDDTIDLERHKGLRTFLKGLLGGITGDNTPDVVAAVDLGSNSFHLVVAQVTDGALKITDQISEMVRLGEGITAAGGISPVVQERALSCLSRFGERLANLPPQAVRVVGTNSLRQMGADCEFIRRAEAILGHPIEVISGIEEARLIYSGVAAGLEVDAGRRLVMDIGGGSTELIIGEGQSPLFLESLAMGCVSITRQHFADGHISAARLEAARLHARRRLRQVVGTFKGLGWKRAIGASGTFKALDKIVRANGWSSDGITPESIQKMAAYFASAENISAITLPGLSQDRVPVILGGWAVAKALMDGLGIELIIVSHSAMREGVMYDLLGRAQHSDIRARSVATLAARYHTDTAHAEMVTRTAMGLLAEVTKAWQLAGETPVQFLSWAATLHEIGRDIAHSGYHKHGAYVLANADLPGFSRQEQQVLSALVLGHRRKFRAAQILAELPQIWGQTTLRLMILLRLAVILHRGRTLESAPPVQLTVLDNGLSLRFPDDWLKNHALTLGDLEAEAAAQAPAFRLDFS